MDLSTFRDDVPMCLCRPKGERETAISIVFLSALYLFSETMIKSTLHLASLGMDLALRRTAASPESLEILNKWYQENK